MAVTLALITALAYTRHVAFLVMIKCSENKDTGAEHRIQINDFPLLYPHDDQNPHPARRTGQCSA